MKLYVLEHRNRNGKGHWSRWWPFSVTYWNKHEAKARMLECEHLNNGTAEYRVTTWQKVK